jgi:hypothetical protein
VNKATQDDRILLITRLVAIGVVPILVLAFIILYFFPQQTGDRFAWQIKPDIMAVYMGAGYMGGAYVFLQTAVGKRWHRVAGGYLAVTAFTMMMLVATVLHWNRFDINHLAFQIWLGLYVVTPVLIPWLWWKNKPVDSGDLEEMDSFVPDYIRGLIRLFGAGMILLSLVGLFLPSFFTQIWPWQITPLTARILAGWGVLLGVSDLTISNDRRWSSWRVGAISIGLWHVLFIIGAIIHRQDFNNGLWLNWFTTMIIIITAFVIILYIRMEAISRRLKISPAISNPKAE